LQAIALFCGGAFDVSTPISLASLTSAAMAWAGTIAEAANAIETIYIMKYRVLGTVVLLAVRQPIVCGASD